MANTPPEAPTVTESGRPSADHAERVELQKAPRAPGTFKSRAEHPDTDHVAKPVPEPGMDEAVGHELPDPSVENHLLGLEAEVVEDPAHDIRQRHAEEFQ
jgi:hypothetical protein